MTDNIFQSTNTLNPTFTKISFTGGGNINGSTNALTLNSGADLVVTLGTDRQFLIEGASSELNTIPDLNVIGLLPGNAASSPFTDTLSFTSNLVLSATNVAACGANLGIAAGCLRTYDIQLLSIAQPAAPTIATSGTAGSTTYSYVIVGETSDGTSTQASTVGSTTTGNAALGASNFNIITFPQIAGVFKYLVYRTVGGATQGLIATLKTAQSGTVTAGVFTLDDKALVGDGTTATTSSNMGSLFLSPCASGAPTSAGTAGTAGQVLYFGGLLYFCSATGVAGSATWNKLSMTAV